MIFIYSRIVLNFYIYWSIKSVAVRLLKTQYVTLKYVTLCLVLFKTHLLLVFTQIFIITTATKSPNLRKKIGNILIISFRHSHSDFVSNYYSV